MTSSELLKSIDEYKTNRVQFRYTRKHPIKSNEIIKRLKCK